MTLGDVCPSGNGAPDRDRSRVHLAVMIFILPRIGETLHQGLMDAAAPVVEWSTGFLDGLITAFIHHWWI